MSRCHARIVGARSGCDSNVTNIKAFFFSFFVYLLTILLVSVVSFRWFCFVVSGFSTCLRSGGYDENW